jgi:hypothetical protein
MVAGSRREPNMKKLLFAIVMLGFGVAQAQTKPEKTEKQAQGQTKPEKAEKPAMPPSGAAAAPAAGAPEMTPPKPGPEQDALKPFVRNGTYTGTRTMPDGKETPTKGKQACKWLPGNMWASCDIEMSTGAGKTATKWMGHLVMGYDTMAKGYRAVMTDNMGMMGRMKGALEGSKMTWESMDEMKVPGMPSKERVTDDLSDPKAEKMTFEGWINGKWTPTGSGTFKFTGK